MRRLPWVKRVFQLDLPVGVLPNILVRLEGAGIRLAQYADLLSEKQASSSNDGKWTVKQHIGHLTDLEPLHMGRLEDFKLRATVLREADMSNAATEAADHNQSSMDSLLDRFWEERSAFVREIGLMDEETLHFVSQHPRLNTPMRVVDLAFFTAEHDDHHIASIEKIAQFLSQ